MLSGSDGKLSHLRLVSWFIGENTPLILGDSDVRFTPKATRFSTNRDVRFADS
jgi:hypothetical protein